MKVNFKPIVPSGPPDPYLSTLVLRTVIGWDFENPTMPKLYKATTTQYDETTGVLTYYEFDWPVDFNAPIELKEITPAGDTVWHVKIKRFDGYFVISSEFGPKYEPRQALHTKFDVSYSGRTILRNFVCPSLPTTGNSIQLSYHCEL